MEVFPTFRTDELLSVGFASDVKFKKSLLGDHFWRGLSDNLPVSLSFWFLRSDLLVFLTKRRVGVTDFWVGVAHKLLLVNLLGCLGFTFLCQHLKVFAWFYFDDWWLILSSPLVHSRLLFVGGDFEVSHFTVAVLRCWLQLMYAAFLRTDSWRHWHSVVWYGVWGLAELWLFSSRWLLKLKQI